ncbi:YbaK/EbsC family protein, partial [Psychrobacter sp. 1Y1]|uniref:YbaK/EbsC family protein n=1 Tax=Psychrobacter sp. 1Y1 TaxID=3453574 RepID=UPI003F48A9C0
AKATKAKKAVMAEGVEVQRSSGYVLGGVSPLGQKRQLITVIDESAASLDKMFVSGGRRGLDIELAPEDIKQLLKAQFAPITA